MASTCIFTEKQETYITLLGGVVLGGTFFAYMYIDALSRKGTYYFLPLIGALLAIIFYYCAIISAVVFVGLLLSGGLFLLYTWLMYSIPSLAVPQAVYLIKPFVVSLVWLLIGCVATTIDFLVEGENAVHYLLFLSERYSYLLALCIIYDIKDLRKDSDNQNRTIATYLSPTSMKCCYAGLLLLSSVLALLSYRVDMAAIIAATNAVALLLVIKLYSTKDSYLYYLGLVDGHIIFQSLTILVYCYVAQ